jgi:lysyl-tRNA synthetase class II
MVYTGLKDDWQYHVKLLRTVASKLYGLEPEETRGNGRWVRNFANQVVKQQKIWLSQHPEVDDAGIFVTSWFWIV